MQKRRVVCGVAMAVLLAAMSGCGQPRAASTVTTPPSTSPSTTPPTTVPPGSLIAHGHLPSAPPRRLDTNLAFDAQSNSVLLFGGLGAFGSLDDTWSWNGSGWQQLSGYTGSTTKTAGAMAYDPVTGKMVLLSTGADVPLSDPCQRPPNRPPSCTPPREFRAVNNAALWGWDGQSWKALTTNMTPPGPAVGMAVLPDGSVLVPSGGTTWLYRAGVWRMAAPLPPGRATGMATDPATQQIILVVVYQPGLCMPHSGCTEPAQTSTYSWTGNAWHKLAGVTTPGLDSQDAYQGALVADPAGGGVLALAADHSTWRFSSGRWRQVADPAHSPPALIGLSLGVDAAHHEVVGFGGVPVQGAPNTVSTNDTWIWDGVRWQQLTAPLAPNPTPPAPAPVGCHLNNGALAGQADPPPPPPAPTLEITLHASDLFVVSPCHLKATFMVALDGPDGKLLPVAGNPSTVTVNTDAPLNAAVVVASWAWTHACSSTPVTAMFTDTGVGAATYAYPVPIGPLPRCSRPSTLNGGTYVVSAPQSA